jgi:hypothetical protein
MLGRADFVSFLSIAVLLIAPLIVPVAHGQATPQQSSSSSKTSSPQHVQKAISSRDAGSVVDGVYRNPFFAFTCKIPAGWVLRTDEMNARDDEAPSSASRPASESANTGRVLLAAFSRPPVARGEDVNSSILIAAESTAAYPGLKDAAQYLGPVSEVAQAQGFDVDEDPYEFAVGAKTLARKDFEKDVATRVMQQSTLVMLARGYAVSFTFIGGTEDEVEELVDGLSFTAAPKPQAH